MLTDALPFYNSLSIGVWVRAGSRMEDPGREGLAHFTEHMMFKGTETRSAQDLVREPESRGALINAFTSREETCFYIQTPVDHTSTALEILGDMLSASVFSPADINNERDVILEEITATEDTPEEYVVDLFQEEVFGKHPLGHPILGSRSSVSGFSREDIHDFWKQHYHPENMVISAAGNLDHERFVEQVERFFLFSVTASYKKTPSDPPSVTQSRVKPFHKGFNQMHICCGTPVCSAADPERTAVELINTWLGSGMSSRLFQLLREEQGMAYAVYSYPEFYSDGGIFTVYLGTDHKKSDTAMDLVKNCLNNLADTGIDRDTLNRVKRQYKGRLQLNMESTYKRMAFIARQWLERRRFAALDEVLDEIDAITVHDIHEAAQRYFTFDHWTVVKLY